MTAEIKRLIDERANLQKRLSAVVSEIARLRRLEYLAMKRAKANSTPEAIDARASRDCETLEAKLALADLLVKQLEEEGKW